MNSDRQRLRQDFLDCCDLHAARLEPLVQDASFRRYFRIHDQNQTYILMDAPPTKEKIEPFINIAKHLSGLNLKAPVIHHFDINHGFILLEDFGDNTFTRLLAANHDENDLYNLAVDTLINLHKNPHANSTVIPEYSSTLLISEALLLPDWYCPYRTGNPISKKTRDSYIQCWESIIASLPVVEKTLVLRDYHVDNLIKLDDGQCGLLDFQDAVIGCGAYDLVSLLEDARRDISADLQKRLLKHYFAEFEHLNHDDFMRWYAVLGAQRHCKVLGIFTRLSVRDKKHHYLDHLSRVDALLRSHLHCKDLQPLKYWLMQNNL